MLIVQALHSSAQLQLEQLHGFNTLSTNICSAQAMQEIWGHGEHVQCLHPAANCIQGREDVS